MTSNNNENKTRNTGGSICSKWNSLKQNFLVTLQYLQCAKPRRFNFVVVVAVVVVVFLFTLVSAVTTQRRSSNGRPVHSGQSPARLQRISTNGRHGNLCKVNTVSGGGTARVRRTPITTTTAGVGDIIGAASCPVGTAAGDRAIVLPPAAPPAPAPALVLFASSANWSGSARGRLRGRLRFGASSRIGRRSPLGRCTCAVAVAVFEFPVAVAAALRQFEGCSLFAHARVKKRMRKRRRNKNERGERQ